MIQEGSNEQCDKVISKGQIILEQICGVVDFPKTYEIFYCKEKPERLIKTTNRQRNRMLKLGTVAGLVIHTY